ncbi:hypothetical protein GYH30_044778 [Glycine max]|nr:hypothetical protein GYH30_044778 [Glycine max]
MPLVADLLDCSTKKPLSTAALNFLLAGRDTSPVMLSWFFCLVMNHLAMEEKIPTELTGSYFHS